MTPKEFFEKYNGKYLDVDQAYGPQCVDVIKAYFNEVLAKGAVLGNANDYWNMTLENFEKIPNSSTAIPQLGDIIVWGKKIGSYGHIAIATGIGDDNHFESFDQNFPLNSPCGYIIHTYYGVLGWLRPLKEITMDIELLVRILHQVWRITHNANLPDEASIKLEADQYLKRYDDGEEWAFSELIDKWAGEDTSKRDLENELKKCQATPPEIKVVEKIVEKIRIVEDENTNKELAKCQRRLETFLELNIKPRDLSLTPKAKLEAVKRQIRAFLKRWWKGLTNGL